MNLNQKNNRRDFLKTAAGAGAGLAAFSALAAGKADRLVVLTFDDAVKTHRRFVGPLLKELGFGASFFVTHRWMMDDPEHYMTWAEIAELHEMGFEIGNHSWNHPAFSMPREAARLREELALVERALREVGVPRPVSFAWCGNAFGPEAVRQLDELGYDFARRGMQPEAANGKTEMGPLFDPRKHHRLLIPTTGDANPNWTTDHFQAVVELAEAGRVAVLQFHGVPDPHPWVNTLPERFRDYMIYLKDRDFKVISLRDVKKYLPVEARPADPLLHVRYPDENDGRPGSPPGDPRRGVIEALGGPFLVFRDTVQAELKLSDDQKQNLLAAFPGYLAATMKVFPKLQDLTPEEREKEMQSHRRTSHERLAAFLKETLTVGQLDRLGQLELQQQGLFALGRPEIATELKITDGQQKQFTEAVQEMQRKKPGPDARGSVRRQSAGDRSQSGEDPERSPAPNRGPSERRTESAVARIARQTV